MANLRHRCRGIIFHCFTPGANKHAAKKAKQTEGHIYSFGTRNELLDQINIFTKWVKENNIPIKYPEEITKEMVSSYLTQKAETCTQNTTDCYRSLMASFGNCVKRDLHLAEFDLHVPKVLSNIKCSNTRGAAAVIPREEYDIILEYCISHPSGSSYAVLLENYLGGRVTDVCERMTFCDNKVVLICKAGKHMTRELTPVLHKLLNDPRFAAWRTEDNRFSFPDSDSINRFLSRLEMRLGLNRHSFHDIRRLLAQQHYDELRRNNIDRDTALSLTGIWLNHGPKRKRVVLQSYVSNPW